MISCDQARLVEEYQSFEELSWPAEDTLSFMVPAIPNEGALATLRVKYNEEYDYHNLYLRYILRDSTGSIQTNKLIYLKLFDPKSGKPLGSGYGNSFTVVDTLPSLKATALQNSKMQFIQYMRSNALDGIESLGIKIEKGMN
ncbi:hypothetical protein GCM10007049_38220 [Echinicola pacifica]|uniref:Gliding motility-associated lipoprotein GldH n=2 Tax=Echinicola pacifica TaxID=346377 RepID=A0A918UY14_9BACT|nr:hypothetical protein GCM10007049_38220 [Echinicola pacifica]